MRSRRAVAALLWAAAFLFAVIVFLAITPILRFLPPTPHVAVGLITIENASKARDYAAPILFLAIVPLLTILLAGRVKSPSSPIRKDWPELSPFQALLICEVLSCVLFVSIVTSQRTGFVALFAALIFLIRFPDRAILAATPLVVLPLLAIVFVPAWAAVVTALVGIVAVWHWPPSASSARAIVVYCAVPLLVWSASYAAMSRPTAWIDLFHRGEVLGPASDYLRGKVAYRDVFALHGLLVDGQLDAWLMQIFGRDEAVSLIRHDVFAALVLPALWLLGVAAFDAIPLAFAVLPLGVATAVDNERALFEIITAALLIAGVRGRVRRLPVFLSGVAAAIALFFSLDTGLYSIGGALLFLIVAGSTRRIRVEAAIASFLAGLLAGAAPFLIVLGVAGGLLDFIETSFVTIPKIIDATWSIPYPNLLDLPFGDEVRYILGPLMIAISITFLIHRFARKRDDAFDMALLTLTVFAILTLRSAFGRADLQHQLFGSFLIAPIAVMLVWRAAGKPGVVGLIVLAVVFWAPNVVAFHLQRIADFRSRVRQEIPNAIAADVNARIAGLQAAVDRRIGKDEPIFDFSDQPGLYFFLARRNPTRFYQVPILSPPDSQLETILALEKTRTPIVIRRSPQGSDAFDGVDNDDRAQAVAAYIDDNYEFDADVRGVELWRRKPGSRRLDFESYMRAIHMPAVTDLVIPQSRPRIVFAGVQQSSDLMLKNPASRPLRLHLRYSGGGVSVDRRLTLPPFEGVMYPSVARSLFGASNGPGTLWIEYRQGIRPLASITLAP